MTPKESSTLDLTGKLVFVDVTNPPKGLADGVLLEYAEFREVAGRLFLVGRTPDIPTSGWLVGIETAVAWDSVVHYMIFKSREDFEKRAASHKPKLRERLVGR